MALKAAAAMQSEPLYVAVNTQPPALVPQ